MQEASPANPWTHPLALALATILGFLGRTLYHYIKLFLERGQRKADTHEISARATKTLAEARQIQVRSDTEVSNIVLEVTARIMEMQEKQAIKLEVVTLERDDLRHKVSLMEVELKSYEAQIRKMEGFIKMKELNYSDADKT